MTQLLVLRERLRGLYQKYTAVCHLVFRFLIGFITFSSVNNIIGYYPGLNHLYVELILAVVSMILPGGFLLGAAAVFVVVHIFYVSPILALFVAVIFLLAYFMYIRFVPEHAYAIIAIPIAFPLHLVYGVPMFLGLVSSPLAVLPITFGVFIYYLLQTVTSVVSTSTETGINLYHAVLQGVAGEEDMYATLLIFCVVSIVVYIIRTREWNFAFELSIVVGTICNIVLFLIVNFALNSNLNMPAFLIGSLLSALLVWVIQFMRLALNYAGVENVQFEDDEYYYYVRAVPKMSVAAPQKSVKHFNSRRFSEYRKRTRDEQVKEESNVKEE
ncbi:MAG: hypothetical protein LUH14_12440 [Clostridiaceae bacterium]|nr:hypothetical protein [Clostridiaceae bacterium]